MFSHFILIISDSTLHWMQCILKDFTIVLAVPLNPVMGFTPTLSDGYFYLWICICVFVYLYLCYFICVLCWRWPGSPLWWVWRLNYQPLLSDSILSAVLLRSAWIWENSGNRCEKASKCLLFFGWEPVLCPLSNADSKYQSKVFQGGNFKGFWQLSGQKISWGTLEPLRYFR